ncbi:hypothetical protein R2F61_04110 [Mollicutes bacterium LVI A0078]|nr:hypothetical protein RZE84_04130 [Mollicutes bacterium LVI A0075]WOO91746.1 hypothetical protein R2F61_04110 [Mollicutes bacterium LVI A0078]
MSKKILYFVLVIGAFVIGTQVNINFKTSQVFTSDVIAVVNNDQKVEYLDGYLKLGDDFVDKLDAEDSQYSFQTTSSAEANQGIVSGKYGAEIVIPSNFTTSILSVNSEMPTSTSVTYTMNEKLLASKSKKMEDEIVRNISEFEDNITYMYMYSIFDSLHTTQEGVETVGENSQPVFTFLEEVSEIDIVGNHDYELKPNNTDSFSIIDISKQIKRFSETIDSYKAEVANIIEVYKDQNNAYGNMATESLEVMDENDQLLNERIDNVEDTLDTLVETNEQYTASEYSITNATPNITEILTKYFNQLKVVNDTREQNQLTLDNTNVINDSLQILNDNSQVSGIKSLFATRVSYYNDLDQIVNECLSQNESGASECISSSIDNYKSGYTSYDNIISQFKDEQDYYQTMTYYLEHIGTAADSEAEAGDVQSFTVPVETGGETTSQASAEQTESPEFALTSYGENLTPTDSSDNNLIGLHIDNANSVSSISLDITESKNIKSITNVATTLDNAKVVVEDNRIRISSIKATELNLVFNVEKTIDSNQAKLSLAYNDEQETLTVGEKSNLTVSPNVSESDITLDYAYTVQPDDSTIEYQDSNLVSEYGNEAFSLSNDGDGAVTATDSGLTIDASTFEEGSVIEFSITFDNLIGNQIFIENYTIDGQTASFPIISELATVSSSLRIYDDPYTVDLDNEEDDIDGNDVIEPQEQIGLRYEVEIESPAAYSVSKLKFNADLESLINLDVSPQVVVQVGDATLDPTISTNDTEVTIDFGEEVSSTDIPDPGSDDSYELPIDIYINLELKSDIELGTLDDDLAIGFTDLELTTNGTANQTHLAATDDVDLAIGAVSLEQVNYTVNSDSCLGASTISECKFEAGEEITKQITVKNSSDDAAAGLVLSEEFTGDDLITTDAPSYEFAMINDAIDGDNYIADKMTADGNQIKFSMPANSELVITEQLTVEEDIVSNGATINSTSLEQYSVQLGHTETELTITPLALLITILDDQQVTEDGVITPNEAVNIKLEVKNASTRGKSHKQYIEMTESSGRAVDSIRVVSVEDEDWNPVDYSPVDGHSIVINQSLDPNEAFTVNLRINFNNLNSAPSTEQFEFISYKGEFDPSEDVCSENNCDTISYHLSTNPDYLQLARDQAANTPVIGEDPYGPSLDKSQQVVDESSKIMDNVSDMRTYINKYIALNAKLNKFTTLDNTQIEDVQNLISSYQFEDGLEPVSPEYCADNKELSCQIFDLFNQIVTSESGAKNHYQEVLTTIDPSLEEQLGTKDTTDGQPTDEPINIGADFNGYGECQNIVNAENGDVTEGECDLINPGINERIEMQDTNVENVKIEINKILDNETEEVNEEPYQQEIMEIDEQTNQVMDKVETENNELFGKKIDVYDENYQEIMDYVTEISEDPAYAKAIKKFKNEELTRQEESALILKQVYNLLPNTNLDGMPNKMVYSFIASPFAITEQTIDQPISTITKASHPWLLIIIVGMFIATLLLVASLYYINREV